MSSYNKSLIALGMALAAVVAAGLWLRALTVTLGELTAKSADMQAQIAAMGRNTASAARLERNLEDLRGELKLVADKFAGKDYEIHQLVMAVVNSAAMSGMEMINASTLEDKRGGPLSGRPDPRVSSVSHEIRLKGSYPGFVRFLQSMDDWAMGVKLRSMEVVPSSTAKLGAAGEAIEDEIDVFLKLSVLVLEEAPGE